MARQPRLFWVEFARGKCTLRRVATSAYVAFTHCADRFYTEYERVEGRKFQGWFIASIGECKRGTEEPSGEAHISRVCGSESMACLLCEGYDAGKHGRAA